MRRQVTRTEEVREVNKGDGGEEMAGAGGGGGKKGVARESQWLTSFP